MVVVVGGSRRKCGKTAIVESLIRENEEAGWTAIKITSHSHAPSGSGDTARYLAAGARRAELIVAPDIAPCLGKVQEWIAASPNTIIESTRILDHLQPDAAILVVDAGGEIKGSCLRHLGAVGVVILERRTIVAPLECR